MADYLGSSEVQPVLEQLVKSLADEKPADAFAYLVR
jgi:hypothetical protein